MVSLIMNVVDKFFHRVFDWPKKTWPDCVKEELTKKAEMASDSCLWRKNTRCANHTYVVGNRQKRKR